MKLSGPAPLISLHRISLVLLLTMAFELVFPWLWSSVGFPFIKDGDRGVFEVLHIEFLGALAEMFYYI